MLSFVTTDVQGQKSLLPPALAVTMNMDEDVPADDLYAVFPYREGAELAEVAVYDGERLIFTGVVDEEERILSDQGEYLRISARSLAALLLDNEAAPRTYDHPGAAMIYRRHAQPYGIRLGDCDDAVYFGELDIVKGSSQWSVIKSFCSACYATSPRVSADGVLYLKGIEPGEEIVFGEGGIGCIAVSEKVKRCEEISRVNVRTTAAQGYRFKVENADALSRGIRRERYINAVLTATPIKCADMMIESGRAKAYTLTLTCPERLTDILGRGAVLHDPILGEREGLYISSVKYRLTSAGETTELRLKRRIR
jgi:prophage tail gpP-like protein